MSYAVAGWETVATGHVTLALAVAPYGSFGSLEVGAGPLVQHVDVLADCLLVVFGDDLQ